MSSNEVKAQHKDWAAALFTGNEPSVYDLDVVIFGLSSSKDGLETMIVDDGRKVKLKDKKDTCLSLLTSSLITNVMTTLYDLEATPLALVSSIQMVPFNGQYLPPSMLVPLISAKAYLSLARVHPGLPEITGLTRTQLE